MSKQDLLGGITILGLGPGNPQHLTRAAWDWLCQIPEVYLRTRHHPLVSALPSSLKVYSFDEFYERNETFEGVYQQIVERVLELGQRPAGVTYAVPGHPYVAEATCPEIVRRARTVGIPVQVIEGLSFLEPTFTALGVDPFPQMMLVDALELGFAYHPIFPPSVPVLITQIYSREIAANVKLTLNEVYPDNYPVRLVHAAGTEQQIVEDLLLFEIDRSSQIGLLTALFLPAMEKETSFEEFQSLIAHLRSPEGCPWDREQTQQTLRTNLLEEAYEVLTALDTDDPTGLREELGDLLLQIVLHTQIASELGEFKMTDVLAGIHRKIVRRHPHVFGELKLDSSDRVVRNWEALKAAERRANGEHEVKGLLEGVPKALPALAQAQAYQTRAARVGFDWRDIAPVVEKVHEELDELLCASDGNERENELGDLLFAVVNLARWYRVDAESALRRTNERFYRRFKYIEEKARQSGRDLHQMSLEEMDVFWEEAKGLE